MTPEERRGFEQQMRGLDDTALRRLVVLEESAYRPEVVDIARDELARRKLPLLSLEEYWRQFPEEWMTALGFCYPCWIHTIDEPPSAIAFRGLIGTLLLGRDNPCSTCGSVVSTKWFCVVVPIIRMSRYRVIYAKRRLLTPPEYIGRRLK